MSTTHVLYSRIAYFAFRFKGQKFNERSGCGGSSWTGAAAGGSVVLLAADGVVVQHVDLCGAGTVEPLATGEVECGREDIVKRKKKVCCGTDH